MALAAGGLGRGSLEVITRDSEIVAYSPQPLPNEHTRLVAFGAGDASVVELAADAGLGLGFGHFLPPMMS